MSKTFSEIVKFFGFTAQKLGQSGSDWLRARASASVSVAVWDGTTLKVHRGSEAETDASIDSLPKALNLFSLGAHDFLLSGEEYIEFPLEARRLLETMVILHTLKFGSDEEKAGLSEQTPPQLPAAETFLESGNAFLINLWGKACSLEDRYSEAGVAFRRAAELLTVYGEPCSNLGTLLWKLGKRSEAFVLFAEGFMRNPLGLSCQLNFFDAGYELREYESMAGLLESQSANFPDCIEFRHHLALCYEKTDKRALACDVLRRLLDEFPQDEEARVYLEALSSEASQVASSPC